MRMCVCILATTICIVHHTTGSAWVLHSSSTEACVKHSRFSVHAVGDRHELCCRCWWDLWYPKEKVANWILSPKEKEKSLSLLIGTCTCNVIFNFNILHFTPRKSCCRC